MNERPNINDVAIAHMEQKYGEAFTYFGPWGISPSPTFELLVTSASFPSLRVLVQIENFRDEENRVFRDNFLAVKYMEESINFFQSSASSVFGDAKIFYNVFMDGQSHDLPANATFQEFLADTRTPHTVLVVIRESDFNSKEQAEKVAELFAASQAHFYLTILVVDKNAFEVHDHSTHNTNISLNRFVHCAIIRIFDDGINIEWRGEE